MLQGVLHFEQKLIGHVSRKAVPDQDALDDEVFAIGRHGIGGNEPAALTQTVGEVVKGEAYRPE